MNTKKHTEKYIFPTPESLREARDRIQDLVIGVLNIEKQLGDKRRQKTSSEAEYDNWRERTKSARIFMVAEMRYVKGWVLERRRLLLAKEADIWPMEDSRRMLQRAVIEGRKQAAGDINTFTEVLDSIDLYLTHDA